MAVRDQAAGRGTLAPVGRERWVVVACTFCVASVSYLDRNNLTIAAASLQREFALTELQLGTVFAAFILGYALTQPIAGRIADRFGAARVIAAALLWWSVFTALLPAIPGGLPASMAMLLAVRFLLGIGESVIFPASNRLVANWIPSSERGLANGWIFAGVGVGAGIAPPLITSIMLYHSWRWAFWLCALIGVAAAGMWVLLVRNSPAEQPRLRPAEAAYIDAGLPIRKVDAARQAGWSEIILDRNVAALTLSYFCFGYVAYIFFTWFFKYLSDIRGLNLRDSALYATLPFAAMTLASLMGGMISDGLLARIGKRAARCGVAGMSLLAASGFVVAATQVADARLAALILAGGAGSLYFAQSAYWAISADMGGASAGSLSGIMNMGAQAGGIMTATVTPAIASSYGWTASFVCAALVCLVGAAAWMFVDPFHVLAVRRTD